MVMNFLEDESEGFCVVPVPDYQPRCGCRRRA